MKCPNCGTTNPPVARFCFNCGISLLAQSAEQPPGPHISTDLARRAVAAGPGGDGTRLPGATASGPITLDGERRVVTILFCDVKGSTALAEQLDPEEWAEIMNEAFGYLIGPVYRYEGTVARLMGDAILAFFGAPSAHENDPQRAILAGLGIIEGIQAFREKVNRQRGLDFDLRIGIHTGLVVVGEIGSKLAMEYTAMGDVVNLAARLEQEAEAGTVLISEDTYRLVAPLFDVEALGNIQARGKRQPVQVYRVLGLKEQPGQLRGIDGRSTALVGRRSELARLHRAIEEVQAGSGGIVCLTGEAGIGKSRLIDELRSEWTAHPAGAAPAAAWQDSRAISYTTIQPYAAFQDLIRNLCGVTPADAPAVVREKIFSGCLIEQARPEDCHRVSRAFEALLGVQAQPDAPRLEGEAFKRELFEAMLITWREWSAQAPTVLAFDDLQRADPASVELLLHLFQLAARAPVLFLCAFRPDRQSPAWKIKAAAERSAPNRYIEITLGPLNDADSSALVDGLLAAYALPADQGLPVELRRRILEKAEGNPFFVEEVIRSLIDRELLVPAGQGSEPGVFQAPGWRVAGQLRDFTIPDNVQALVMVRLDRLDEAARHTLQVAAVIGRTFHYRLLAKVADPDAPLDRQLADLQAADLIQAVEGAGEGEYMFHHALTHDTVYNSILLKHRRRFHLRVGEALEALYPDRRQENASLLAHHFHAAGDKRAVGYYLLAGDAALRLYAAAEAIENYERALEAGSRLAREEIPYERLYLQRGRALELSAQYQAALDNYTEMQALAQQSSDAHLLLSALSAQATLRATPTPVNDSQLAQQLCNQALDLAWELNDQPAAARILWTLLLINIRSGRPDEAIIYGERALSLARSLNLRELLAYTMNDISQAYLGKGEIQRGRGALVEARKLWQELDNLPMLADSLGTMTLLDFFLGEYKRAIRCAEEALQISERIGNLWGQAYSQMYLGGVYYELGEIGTAIGVMENCLRLAEKAQFMAPLVNTRTELGKLYASLGLVERGRELIQAALEISRQYTPPWLPWVLTAMAQFHIIQGDLAAAGAELERAQRTINKVDPVGLTQGMIQLVRSELAMAQADYQQVITWVDRLLPVRKLGLRTYLPDALYLKGSALFALGRVEEACQVLEATRAEAEALNSRRLLWRIYTMSARAEAQRGDLSASQDYHQRSLAEIDFIAGRLGSEELRASFLSLNDVREVYRFAGEFEGK